MRNSNKSESGKKPAVKNLKEILGLLGEQIEQLRPECKPDPERISAARASATVVNSYMGTIKLGIMYARMNGEKPNLDFLGIETKSSMPSKAS